MSNLVMVSGVHSTLRLTDHQLTFSASWNIVNVIKIIFNISSYLLWDGVCLDDADAPGHGVEEHVFGDPGPHNLLDNDNSNNDNDNHHLLEVLVPLVLRPQPPVTRGMF